MTTADDNNVKPPHAPAPYPSAQARTTRTLRALVPWVADSTRRSGLANLAERAGQLGGTLQVGPAGDRGTELRWQVPLT